MRSLSILIALVVTGCVTAGTNYAGSGPLPPFTPAVQHEINTYFSKQETDRALAVSLDGRFAQLAYCNNHGVSVYRCSGIEALAIGNCERTAKQTCKLYASDNEVVWKGALVRTAQEEWRVFMEIGGKHYKGTAKADPTSPMQQFSVDTPEGTCQGAVNSRQRVWHATCPNQVTASGRIITSAPHSTTGDGSDSLGRKIAFTTMK